MGVFSGKYGVIGSHDTVRNWMLSEISTPAEYRASNTLSGTGREEGIYDFRGSCEGYGAVPPVMPGEYFDFLGFTAPATGAYGTAGVTKSAVNAIVEEVTLNWNFATGELLNWAMSFAAGEPLPITEGAAATTDLVLPVPKPVSCLKVTLTESNTVWPNIVSVALTIRSNNQTFVNSSTLGMTGRRPGIIDFTCAVVEENNQTDSNLVIANCLGTAPGGNNILRLWVDATTYWDLYWAHLVDVSDLRVDMDTGAIIQQTNNFAMAGFNIENGQNGHIGRPGEDGASNPWWWPTEVLADTLPF